MKVGQAVIDGDRVGRVGYVSEDGVQVVFNHFTEVSEKLTSVWYLTVSYSNDAIEKFLEVA